MPLESCLGEGFGGPEGSGIPIWSGKAGGDGVWNKILEIFN